MAVDEARSSLSIGACFYSISIQNPVRIDIYRARVVDGLGQTIHERLFAVEISEGTRSSSKGSLDPRQFTTHEYAR